MQKMSGLDSKAKPQHMKFQFGPWMMTATKSHILQSEGEAREKFESMLELPQVPEMIFADNILRVEHTDGFGLEFNALDALKHVDAHNDVLKVAVAHAWKEARADCEHINEVVKPFDWTYTTDYMGTLLGKDIQMQVAPSIERIDMEKLKVREKIHFYEDILLFEDELSDNGTSILNVKIRVMPSSFLILLRQFMRVDNVLVRVIDTRFYHEAEKDYIIRENCLKEAKVQDLKVPLHVLTDPNEVVKCLPTCKETVEKLLFPSKDNNDTQEPVR